MRTGLRSEEARMTREFIDEAVALLRSHGYQAKRLAEDSPDWRAACR